MNHENWEHTPLIDPDEVHPPEDTELLIATGLSRRTKLARRLLEFHTGDPELFLTAAEEQDLAKLIQDGLTSESFLENVSDKDRRKYQAQIDRFEASAQTGRDAQRQLIECNLRFAAYMARASMNITTNSDDTDEDGSISNGRIGTFADIRALRSPHASLDDRIQIASLGLVEAARTFKPRVAKDSKKPIRFLTHAAWHVHAALSKEVATTEAPGVRLPAGKRTELSKARNSPDDFSEEKLDEFAFIHSMMHTLPYDNLELDAFAPEEYEDEYTGIPELTPSEVIGDSNETSDTEQEALRAVLRAELEKILPTLSEREAGVIRLRFGLTDGTARTLDEIGAVYGITRERVRQIESKTMSLLRHPDRSSGLTDYLDDDTTTLHHLQGSPYTLTARTDMPNVHSPYVNPYKKEYLFRPVATDPTVRRSEDRELWQGTPDDNWDTPVRDLPHDTREAEAHTERLFASILRHADADDFKHTEGQMADYPWDTYEDIWANCGAHLKPRHIEAYWNTHAHTLINRLRAANGKDFDLDRVSLLFSALLAETMKDDDVVELDIPQAVNGKLCLFGARLTQGRVVVNGDLGDYAGYYMSNLAQLHVNGSVKNHAAAYSSDMSSLTVGGDAGADFAHGATGEPALTVRGRIKSLGTAPKFEGEITAGGIQTANIARVKLASQTTLRPETLASS